MAYAFQKYIDEQKHLDTDELRHTMKPICHVVIQDFKGEEHKFCDKEQLDANGKFRRPKKMMEAESKGFASVADMMEENKKKEEEAKAKVIVDQKAELDDLKKQLSALATSFQSYIAAVHPTNKS